MEIIKCKTRDYYEYVCTINNKPCCNCSEYCENNGLGMSCSDELYNFINDENNINKEEIVMNTNIKSIEFGLENCEVITIPIECFTKLNYNIEDSIINIFEADIIENGTNYISTWSNKRNSPLQRLNEYNDITSIEFIYNNDERKNYWVIWDDEDQENNSYQKTTMENYKELKLSISKSNSTYNINELFNFNIGEQFNDSDGNTYKLNKDKNGKYIEINNNKYYESIINNKFYINN